MAIYSMLLQLLYLIFHLDSLHRNHDSPYFLHFHADSLHTHSNPILRISTLIYRISLILFSNSPFWLLQIAFSVCIPSLYSLIYLQKIVALVQNEHSPYLQVHKSRHQNIYIVYDIISVITKNYLPYCASSEISNICEV